MIRKRPSDQRGHFDLGWLNTYHTFSFGEYYDRQFMGFRSLRVINEDFIRPDVGFPTHPHANMEIVTYVIKGSLGHKDSMGNGSTIYAGEVQYMSAGSGVTHSEMNPETTQETHLLQIWILPEHQNTAPRYGQKYFEDNAKQNKLCLIVSQDGAEGSIAIDQKMTIHASVLDQGKSLQKTLPDRYGYVHVVSGQVKVGDETLSPGDGLFLDQEDQVSLTALETAEFLVFSLP